MRIVALASLVALVASLALGGAGRSQPAATPVGATRAGAALQVFLDPQTGLPREPTEAELAALRAVEAASAKVSLRAGATAPEEIHLPDGTAGLRLDPRYFEMVVMCRQPDGSFGSDCPATGSRP